MPSYRFSWSNFDDTTVLSLSAALHGPNTIVEARPWLGQRIKRPTPDFARTTKDVLARVWLRKHPGIAREIYEALHSFGIGPLGPVRVGEACARYVDECRNSRTVQVLLSNALIHFGDADRDADQDDLDLTGVRRFSSVIPRKQPEDRRVPHPHQRQAWDRLDAHLAESSATGRFQGVLVMPTGSGKTYTAAHWVMRNVVNRGGRLLWLAHRQELLNQAAQDLVALSGLATARDVLRIRVVSNMHCRTHQIGPSDDIVVCTVGSLARARVLAEELAADPNLFVVVDEAHHAPAKSYRDFLERLIERGNPRILGITATPTRTVEGERSTLARLFGDRTLHEVDSRALVEQGILARPVPVRVRTGVTVDEGASDADVAHLERFNDLSAEMLDRIGRMSARNELIVQTYLNGRERFGKTLIFATSVAHAAHLAERMQEEGVRADYVASWSPDGTPRRHNGWLIERFRKSEPVGPDPDAEEGALDVLVNVEMMTEGVDVPAVRTVFLARPTQSEILLRQMIGRALRGPRAGGGDTAYLVSFEDHFERFDEWESPLTLVADVMPPAEASQRDVREDEASDDEDATPEVVSWEQLGEVARALRQGAPSAPADLFECVPEGTYVLEYEVDGETGRFLVSRYEHQGECWNALLDTLDAKTPAELAELDAARVHDDYFFDCEPVRPTVRDIVRVIEQYRAQSGRPEYHPLAERAESDPRTLAARVRDEDMGERQRVALVVAAYGTLARAVYPSLADFRAAVDAAVRGDESRLPLGRPIFEPPPEMRLASGPAHDLDALMRETRSRGRELLGHDLPGQIRVHWSHRLIKGWYAKAYFTFTSKHGDGEIRMNRLLDSPAISAATIRYVLWHEYLHLFLKAAHTAEFRAKERLWPDWFACDRELDTLNERFGVQYW